MPTVIVGIGLVLRIAVQASNTPEIETPEPAAMVTLARTANGRLAWKTREGKTLTDLQISESENE